tara:strand:- start:2884 stop:3207 length:324 start_codon:yes stop_codon:yes gene_type:complete
MSKEILEVRGDMQEIYHRDPHSSGFHIQVVQDVAGYLRRNQQEYNETEKGSNWGGEMHKVASIPLVVIEQWWKELGSNPMSKENRGWLTAKLNNRDFYKLRTRAGTI